MTGWWRDSLASASRSLDCVAENNRVCRSGRPSASTEVEKCSMMARSAGRNPKSSKRSASSSTVVSACFSPQISHDSPKILRSEAWNPTVLSRCCSSLPGVAIKTFIRHMAPCSSLSGFPPITSPAEKLKYPPIDRNASKVCTANSRVGEMTRAPSPSDGPHLRRCSLSRRGMRKARVFPEPVLAEARMSRPFSADGIARDWMGVGAVKWAWRRPGCQACPNEMCADL